MLIRASGDERAKDALGVVTTLLQTYVVRR
jgi:hypothetical protein